MAKPKVLVLRAAGINCDLETAFAFEREGCVAERVHVNTLLQNEYSLDSYGLVAVPGGFSYGDDVQAGRVLAIELSKRLGDGFRSFVDRGGLILGICNGFQVLVKTGLLPGSDGSDVPTPATLSWNDSHRYEDRWVYLKVDSERCVMAPQDRQLIRLPVAHGEGKFTMEDSALSSIDEKHQIVFRYCNADGSEPTYPANPNGSLEHVAGICDGTGQVLGLMPHPERALFAWHHPDWTRRNDEEGDGSTIFRAAARAMR